MPVSAPPLLPAYQSIWPSYGCKLHIYKCKLHIYKRYSFIKIHSLKSQARKVRDWPTLKAMPPEKAKDERLIRAENWLRLAMKQMKNQMIERTYLYFCRVVKHARSGYRYHRWRKTVRFCFHAIVNFGAYRKWFNSVEQIIPQLAWAERAKSFAAKVSLPYLRNWFSHAQKIEIITFHYAFLNRYFSADTIHSLGSNQKFALSKILGKSGKPYEITFRVEPTKEGEIIIGFFDVERCVLLASVCGTFGREEDGRIMFWIGCLQGPRPPFGRQDIVDATRDLSGLRPKQAVLHALGALCLWAGVTTLYAPSAQSHVAYTFLRRFLGRGKIKTDYDSYWSEYTQQRTHQGDYQIELPIRRREISEVPAKKRKAWFQRYAHVDEIAKDCERSLNDWSQLSSIMIANNCRVNQR